MWQQQQQIREAPKHGNDDSAGANGVTARREHALELRGWRGVGIEECEAQSFVAVVVREDEVDVGSAVAI